MRFRDDKEQRTSVTVKYEELEKMWWSARAAPHHICH